MGIKITSITLDQDLWALVKEMAKKRRMSASAWLENAARTQLNREQRYVVMAEKRAKAVDATKWPKCTYCSEHHDPEGHWDGRYGR